jgi:bacteriocin-like protein
MEEFRELSDTELDAVSGGAAAAAATTSGDNALAGANNTGPTTIVTTFALFIATGAGPSAVGVAS